MINLLKWLFFPLVSRFGDDGGGDSSGQKYEEEEKRKAALRKKIDQMYGIDDPEILAAGAPDKKPFMKGGKGRQAGVEISPATEGSPAQYYYGPVNEYGRPTAEGSADPKNFGTSATFDDPGVLDEEAYNAAVAKWNADRSAGRADPAAAGARDAMEGENTRLADATRSYYTDQLGRTYTKAERDTRFKLARQGLMGGSEDIYQQGEVKSDRDLGATRVDEAVRRAVADLKTNRERERLNAVSLVNAGAGDSAVSGAQAGLKNSFEVANNAAKTNLFTDLFANTADALSANNLAEQQAALLNRYRGQLATFYPNRGSTTSGRITPSA